SANCWKGSRRAQPGECFLSNPGGADVSIRTLESHLQNRRNPRPRRQRIAQATGIGNSVVIIDDESKLRDSSFSVTLAGKRPRASRPSTARPAAGAPSLLNFPHESTCHHSFRRSGGSRIA